MCLNVMLVLVLQACCYYKSHSISFDANLQVAQNVLEFSSHVGERMFISKYLN